MRSGRFDRLLGYGPTRPPRVSLDYALMVGSAVMAVLYVVLLIVFVLGTLGIVVGSVLVALEIF